MDAHSTLPFDIFWEWLLAHPNCILRAGTPEVVLYDDEDFHWQFGTEGPGTRLVQMLRGKRLTGEMLIEPDHITYVQGVPGDREGEYVFELIAETQNERMAMYFFVMAHGFDDEPSLEHARVH